MWTSPRTCSTTKTGELLPWVGRQLATLPGPSTQSKGHPETQALGNQQQQGWGGSLSKVLAWPLLSGPIDFSELGESVCLPSFNQRWALVWHLSLL